jgi:hypothetical protein
MQMPTKKNPDRDGSQSEPARQQKAANTPVEPEETRLLRRKLRNQASGSEVTGPLEAFRTR